MKATERVSFYSHFVGFLAAIVGTVVLIYVARWSPSRIVISSIYGISLIFLFLASSLYHAFKRYEDSNSFWRKLDHLAIFFLIAGTYTPIAYVYLEGAWRWATIGVQWAIVLGGLFFKLFYLNAPRTLYTVIYLIMGWMAVIPMGQLIGSMPVLTLILIAAGGICFTIGAVFYMLKKPVISPGFGFHEIFHLFILAGATFHYFSIMGTVAR